MDRCRERRSFWPLVFWYCQIFMVSFSIRFLTKLRNLLSLEFLSCSCLLSSTSLSSSIYERIFFCFHEGVTSGADRHVSKCFFFLAFTTLSALLALIYHFWLACPRESQLHRCLFFFLLELRTQFHPICLWCFFPAIFFFNRKSCSRVFFTFPKIFAMEY